MPLEKVDDVRTRDETKEGLSEETGKRLAG